MKKILLLATTMLLSLPAQMQAQTDNKEEKSEDVITVTDKQGNEESEKSHSAVAPHFLRFLLFD